MGDRMIADRCPDCYGTGNHWDWSKVEPQTTKPCTLCGGTGAVKRTIRDDPGPPIRIAAVCGKCGGTGKEQLP
jgi:DnaJ-class molecular chaperone